MRTATLALAASAIFAGAEAGSLLRRNAHANAHLKLDRRNYGYTAEAETCKIVTYTTWAEYTAPPAPKTYDHTQYVQSTVTVVPVPSSSSSSISSANSSPLTTITPTYSYPVPTPDVTTCPAAGTCTFPAKTITLTQTATVCVPTTTVLPPGTHSYGQTTTVVATSTHVTCPYATTYTSSSAVYTTLTSTIYTCPSAGTYTYGGFTTTITETKTIQYPVATTYTPGTYTHPASIVTVTGTITEYTCPYTPYATPTPVKTTPKVESHYVPPPVTTHVAAPPVTTHIAPPATYVQPKPKAKPTTTMIKPAGHGSVDYKNIGNGKQWGMTYTQYNNDKSCKTRDQIFSDIAEIAAKGFRTIRVYAPDCDALPAISDACEAHHLTIVLGVFIRGGDSSYADVYKQVDTISQWGNWKLVEMLVIGNEAVFGGIISSSDLAGLISGCRSQFTAAGYKGPITTSEVVGTIQENPGLCSVIDIVGVNIQPFFNGGHASNAGEFLQSQLELASKACGGKTTYCLEAGWPSAGSPMGNAIASPEAQQQAIESIYASDSGHICYHSMSDDQWKDGYMNGGVEQHFGCAKLFPKAGGYN